MKEEFQDIKIVGIDKENIKLVKEGKFIGYYQYPFKLSIDKPPTQWISQLILARMNKERDIIRDMDVSIDGYIIICLLKEDNPQEHLNILKEIVGKANKKYKHIVSDEFRKEVEKKEKKKTLKQLKNEAGDLDFS